MPSFQEMFPFVKPGDPILADDWNRIISQLNVLNSVGDDVPAIATSAGKFVGQAPRKYFDPDIIRVVNDSGADLPDDRPVLGLNSPKVLPSDVERIVLKFPIVMNGVTPDEDVHAGKFAILLGPAKPDKSQDAIISGVTYVKISVEDEDHQFADIEDGRADRLKTADSGSAFILWKEDEDDGDGERWAIVRLSNVGGTTTSGVDLSPCGCGSCVDRDLMTIDADDFGGEWDAACEYYVTIGEEEVTLPYVSAGVWSGTMTGGDTFTLTVTSQEPEGVTLERNTSAPALVARWVNTVTYWKTHCDATLFLVAVGDDTDDDPPGCSICLKVQRSTACGDCLNDATMTVDKADFGGTANAACSYVIFYDADDRELLYDSGGVWSSDAFGVGSEVLRLTVTSPAADGVLVELLDSTSTVIGSYKNTSTWNPKCPIKLIRLTGDGPCSICLSLDAALVAACAGGG